MKNNPLSKLDFVADEIEHLGDSPKSESERDAKLRTLLDDADKLVMDQMDPIIRETMRDKPEALAEWDSIMRDYAAAIAEDEAEQAAAAAEAAKEAEGLKLAAEISAVMDRISADIDRLMAHDGPSLETEAVLQRSFDALHEMDIEMRLRCRDFPDQSEKWKAMMDSFAEVEARFERGRELEELTPPN
jgi:head-tail adaptor